jgi:hypothetical protein
VGARLRAALPIAGAGRLPALPEAGKIGINPRNAVGWGTSSPGEIVT